MLRKEARRRLRRREIRTRFVAGVTAIAIGLGLAVGGTVAATANPNATLSTPVVNSGGVVTYNQNGLVCNSSLINFQKPAAIDGSNLDNDGTYTAPWGTLSWDVSERTVTWSITPGWDVDVCVKGGTYLSTIDTSTASGTSYTHTYAGLSHLGFRINAAQPTNNLTCEIATNYTGRALTNGDHINMDIVQNGQKFQVNAQIDIRQAQDPVSESGLVVRVNAPGGPYTLPLTTAQRDSGVFAFTYSTYLSDAFTVEWVQFNSTYFNQNRDQSRFLVCGDLPTEELVTPTARMVDLTCDAAGSYTLDDIEGIRWFIGSVEVQPGTYPVASAGTVVVRAEAIAPDYGLEPGAQSEFTFVFTEPDAGCAAIDVNLTLTYMEECAPDSTYTFRVRNAQSFSVPYTFTVAGNPALNGSGVAAPGDSFFDLDVPRTNPAQSYTVTLKWGDGTTILAEQTVKASGRDKVCELTVEPVVDIACATPGSYTVPTVLGVSWSIAGQPVAPGTYTVDDPSTLTLRATATSGHVLYLNGQLSTTRDFTLSFTSPEPCDLPELPVTNASIAFLEPTCDLGQQLDPANFVVEDAELARYAPELSDLEGPSYSVVFVITDDDAVFFDSSEPTPGRTVSDGGKTLTFTGTLLGPDRSEECVTVIELRDPVSYVDTCFEQSFTITRVVGIVYTVLINDETPFVVEWVGDETTRTYAVDEGDSVRVVPSPASDRYTISPEPAPFERTFAVYPFECLETSPLTTASASFTPASCDDMTNWLTLEDAEGVQWWVNGQRAEPGTWPMSTGKTVVTATPLQGFGFPVEQPTRWEFAGVDPSGECLELASTGVGQGALTAGIAGLVMLLLGAGILGYRRQRA
ncbi:LPXTG cell wall anchor domain-containing protein [Microcella frigidaquae]|uniref:LPXTG-motif cell wall-anchored protein n=1 Tax=Microcella frigidaquae TaxID=424758 RepID=A0A840X9R3_9MICO|nr:LPXTG cell wall anchor domain-containing protein [Microcella frigidaquae]MBB5617934.1 LPXTG-motif cell wall-anchored protein [Microcella frigidaquae]NHN44353.1 LPXTG cell wall anchor domain-containing protein [Microcella frigidaquae]